MVDSKKLHRAAFIGVLSVAGLTGAAVYFPYTRLSIINFGTPPLPDKTEIKLVSPALVAEWEAKEAIMKVRQEQFPEICCRGKER